MVKYIVLQTIHFCVIWEKTISLCQIRPSLDHFNYNIIKKLTIESIKLTGFETCLFHIYFSFYFYNLFALKGVVYKSFLSSVFPFHFFTYHENLFISMIFDKVNNRKYLDLSPKTLNCDNPRDIRMEGQTKLYEV